MGAQVFSRITRSTYAVLSDSGAVRDQENLFVTRRRRILFRGDEDNLIDAFKVGSKSSPSGGLSMLCAGIVSAELCEGTVRDPHWEAEVQWIGLHASYTNPLSETADSQFQYRVLSNYSRNETRFPITTQDINGNPYTTFIGDPFVKFPTNSVSKPIGGGTVTAATKCRVITQVPMLQVIGVIVSTTPISPATAKIKTMITKLNETYKPPGELIQNWAELADPTFVYAKGFIGRAEQESNLGVAGKYVPASMQSHRHLSFGDVHAFTMDLTWEQGRGPG